MKEKCIDCGHISEDTDFGLETAICPNCKSECTARSLVERGSPRADFSYEIVNEVVCIIDNDNGKSVTNDAVNVLADIAGQGVNLAGRRVIYRDTRGVWDELVLNPDGSFCNFKSINERERSKALAKVFAA